MKSWCSGYTFELFNYISFVLISSFWISVDVQSCCFHWIYLQLFMCLYNFVVVDVYWWSISQSHLWVLYPFFCVNGQYATHSIIMLDSLFKWNRDVLVTLLSYLTTFHFLMVKISSFNFLVMLRNFSENRTKLILPTLYCIH